MHKIFRRFGKQDHIKMMESRHGKNRIVKHKPLLIGYVSFSPLIYMYFFSCSLWRKWCLLLRREDHPEGSGEFTPCSGKIICSQGVRWRQILFADMESKWKRQYSWHKNPFSSKLGTWFFSERNCGFWN